MQPRFNESNFRDDLIPDQQAYDHAVVLAHTPVSELVEQLECPDFNNPVLLSREFYAQYAGFSTPNVLDILDSLGRGGIGEVYRALEQFSKNNIALKFFLGDTESPKFRAQRDLRAGIANVLAQKGLTTYFGHGEARSSWGLLKGFDGAYVECYEYVDGKNAEQRLDDHEDPSIDYSYSFLQRLLNAREIICGLLAFHEQGLFHGDSTLKNIFVDEYGHAKLGDFDTITNPEIYTEFYLSGTLEGNATHTNPHILFHLSDQPRDDLSAQDRFALGISLSQLLKSPLGATVLGQSISGCSTSYSIAYPQSRLLEQMRVLNQVYNHGGSLIAEDPTMEDWSNWGQVGRVVRQDVRQLISGLCQFNPSEIQTLKWALEKVERMIKACKSVVVYQPQK